jgi:gas vesicle protein
MTTNKIILGVLAAAAAGTIIGLLFAPEDGDNTRKKIKKKTNSLASDLIDALEKSKAKATETAENLKEEGKEYKDAAINKADTYKETAKEEINKF